MTPEQQREQDLGVLLGVRNVLDRFLDLMDANAKAQQAVELTLHPEYPPLHGQVASLRKNVQGILDRWPNDEPKHSPEPRHSFEVQNALHPELHLRCRHPDCTTTIQLQPRKTLAQMDDYLRENGWEPFDHGGHCPEHAAQIAARKRAQHIADEGKRIREGGAPEPRPTLVCTHPGCRIGITPNGAPRYEDGLIDWLYDRGWTAGDGTVLCFQHGPEPEAASIRRQNFMAKHGERTPIVEVP